MAAGPICSSGLLEKESQVLVCQRSAAALSTPAAPGTTSTARALTTTAVPSCGGILSQPSGTFSSPNYPNNYPNNALCTWKIAATNNSCIRVILSNLRLETSAGCVYDYLAVYDGSVQTTSLLGKYCRDSVYNFMSTSNNMAFVFRSDGIITSSGFQATYNSSMCNSNNTAAVNSTVGPSAVPSCGGILSQPSGTFSSPNYPNNYPNNALCTWQIAATNNSCIRVILPNLRLETSAGCIFDYLAVYDGPIQPSSLVGKYCTDSMYNFMSTSNNMTFLFRSDVSITSSGFQATYNSSMCNSNDTAAQSNPAAPGTTSPDGPSCGGILSQPSGNFSSPNYPNNYPDNALCVWQIEATNNSCIRIILSNLRLETSADCVYDFLALFDGPIQPSSLVGSYCTDSMYNFMSTSNSMTVLFGSDESVTSSGFQATYNSSMCNSNDTAALSTPAAPGNTSPAVPSCGGILSQPSGNFSSPNYPNNYPNNALCTWQIASTNNSCIRVILSNLRLETSSGCIYDYLAVYNGSIQTTSLLGKYCRDSLYNFTSTSNSMTVLFRSDESVTSSGFQATYYSYMCNSNNTDRSLASTSVPAFTTTAGPSCGGILSQPSGNFSSPNYPNNYPNNALCTWQIEAKNNFCIKVILSNLRLETSSNCIHDYFSVYDGPIQTSSLLGKDCRDSLYNFTSTSNSMTFLFRSDGSVTSSGFQATYYSYMCNSNDTVALTCSADYMQAVIPRAYLQSLGYSAADVSLNYPNCAPEVTADLIIFRFPYNGCGTLKQVDNDTITYSNTLRAYPPEHLITRQKKLSVDVHCRMYQDTTVEFMYMAQDAIEINKTQYGHFDMNISFYQSPSFLYPVTQSPYPVSLNQELYLQATLHSSDPDLEVSVDTCVASPNPADFTSESYNLIRNGCVRDSTYESYSSPSRDSARCAFNAFGFLNHYPSVYLQCKLLVCSVYDNNSRCHQGCLRRSKRSPGPHHPEVEVVIGPIQRIDKPSGTEISGTESKII